MTKSSANSKPQYNSLHQCFHWQCFTIVTELLTTDHETKDLSFWGVFWTEIAQTIPWKQSNKQFVAEHFSVIDVVYLTIYENIFNNIWRMCGEIIIHSRAMFNCSFSFCCIRLCCIFNDTVSVVLKFSVWSFHVFPGQHGSTAVSILYT